MIHIREDGRIDAGFIAQELQAVESSKSIDYLRLVLDENPDKLEAAPNRLFPVLVKAIQELSAENTALKNLIKNSSSFANLKSSL